MAYQNLKSDFRPSSGESPFALNEILYSRTDSRGVIQAGNEVFRRVSHFDWPELLNAPHKITRHPDMPHGVFWLIWDRLQKGESIGAYVKNQAKDGLHYWVYASIAPCEDGFASARVKPTSALFKQVQDLYAELLEAEEAEGLSPEASAGRLQARLKDLGFPDYDIFAAAAMTEELKARDAGLGQTADPKLVRYATLRNAAETLSDDTASLISTFHQMRTIPHNMQVIASRLEPSGGPVSTLSQNYGSISREMSEWFQDNIAQDNNSFVAIQGTMSNAMYYDSIIRMLQECDQQLSSDPNTADGFDIDKERKCLNEVRGLYQRRMREEMSLVREEAEHIMRTCDTMNRHVTGLSSTRILAKIEAGRIQNAGEGLGDIIVQLGKFQNRISDKLNEIAGKSETILKLIE
ncbi:MAG: chemotaxis protein [Maritimibacter sp.]